MKLPKILSRKPMKVPFHKPYLTYKEIIAVSKVLLSGQLTMGRKTLEFESLFSAYIENRYAVAVNSCTAALHCALRVLDIKEGDEVIVPVNTFVATVAVVRHCGATPVFVDIKRDTHCIDPSKIIEKITEKTKAIIPVHFAGQPCDMDAILEIARSRKLYVIEDAAHALPAWYGNKKIGTLGDITCFSFYATKTLTTGEGGMLVTSRKEWAERAKVLRLHGIIRDTWALDSYSEKLNWKYDVIDLGYKYNTTDISSAIGVEQLKKLEILWRKRIGIATKYLMAFKDNDKLILYQKEPGCTSSWHLFPLRLNLEKLSFGRDEFITRLHEKGVYTSVHFIPLYRMEYFADNYTKYPESEWVFNRTVSLPIYPGMSQREINFVIKSVLEVLDGK